MKPIFGIDVTLDKNNEVINGEEFITRVVSSQKKAVFDEKTENFDETIKKSQLPLGLQIANYVCGLFALIVLVGVLRAGNIVTAFENAPVLIICGILCAIAWLVLYVISKKKEKAVLTEEKADEQVEDINTDIDEIFEELDVPASAPFVDVLLFRYAAQGDEIKVKTVGMQMAEYFNIQFRIYQRDGYLHLANVDDVHSFKLSEIKAIRTVKKRISLMSWNKEVGPTEEKYKKYKLTVNQFDNVFVKPYHILEIEHDGQIYGLFFPSYELDTFEILTGLKAEE